MNKEFYLYIVNYEDEQVVRLCFDSVDEKIGAIHMAANLLDDCHVDVMEQIPIGFEDYEWYDEWWNPLTPYAED